MCPQGWVAATFAVATLLSVFSANQFPILQFLLFPFETSLSSQDLYEALPASLAFIAALGGCGAGGRMGWKEERPLRRAAHAVHPSVSGSTGVGFGPA